MAFLPVLACASILFCDMEPVRAKKAEPTEELCRQVGNLALAMFIVDHGAAGAFVASRLEVRCEEVQDEKPSR